MITGDQWLGALCLWREGRSCELEVLKCIWHVIMNRANDSRNRWPKTPASVIAQPAQFSSFNLNDPNSVLVPSPRNAQDWKAFQNCLLVVSGMAGEDPTFGANHYENRPEGNLPKWADPLKITLQLFPFRFYKLDS